MHCYGSVIELLPEKEREYRELHAAVWPGVLARIHASGLRNYTIYLRRLPDGRLYLFSHFEYHGSDFAADMAAMAADPLTQQWWQLTAPCQRPLADRAAGEWWAAMEQVFRSD